MFDGAVYPVIQDEELSYQKTDRFPDVAEKYGIDLDEFNGNI